MILRVGAFLYRVEFVPGYIIHEGERCLGLCDNDAHTIQVSTLTSLAQQVQVICHEYMEAWLYHFGQDMHDKESYCDLFGMAMTQFVLDLTHQLHAFATAGGAEAQHDDRSIPKDEAPAAAFRGRRRRTTAAASEADFVDHRRNVQQGAAMDLPGAGSGAGARPGDGWPGGAQDQKPAPPADQPRRGTAHHRVKRANGGETQSRDAIAAKLAAAVARVGLRATKIHAG